MGRPERGSGEALRDTGGADYAVVGAATFLVT
jgi:hypothetical protein